MLKGALAFVAHIIGVQIQAAQLLGSPQAEAFCEVLCRIGDPVVAQAERAQRAWVIVRVRVGVRGQIRSELGL